MRQEQDARLWLSAERDAMSSRYDLTLAKEGSSRVVGSIRPLADGRWDWVVALRDDPDGRRTGQADTVDQAAERQFDALCEIDPANFRRLAA